MKITKSALKRLIEEEQDVVKEATRLASREDEADAEAFGAFMDPAFEPGRLADRASGYKDPMQKRADDPRRDRRIKDDRYRRKVAAVAAELAAAEKAGDAPAPLEAGEDRSQLKKEINKAKDDGHISIATWRRARRALRGNPGITGKTPDAISAERARAILDAGFKHSAAAPVRESSTQGNKTMNISKLQIEQFIREELQDILAEQATNPVGMPVAQDLKSMGARDAQIAKVQQMRDAARAEREAKATERAAAAQELEKKKANDKSMEQAALSAMAKLGAERALSQVEKALNNLSIIIEGATEGDDDSEQLGQDLLRRSRSSDLSTRSGKIVDIKKYTRVGSKTSKSVTELARVLDKARSMLADTKNKLRGAKRVSSGETPSR